MLIEEYFNEAHLESVWNIINMYASVKGTVYYEYQSSSGNIVISFYTSDSIKTIQLDYIS